MLKNYIHTTVANTESTLFTVESGKELAVVSVELYGGSSGGTITLARNNGTADVFSSKFAVEAADTVVLDHKQFFEAGQSLKVTATSAGMMICINASCDTLE